MGVLQFDGSDDQLKWTTLASALSNVSDGAWTMAILCKIADFGHFNGLSYLLTGAGAGTVRAGASYNSTAASMMVDIGAGSIFPSDFSSTTTTYIFAFSKAAGSANPRLGWAAFGGGWTHEAGASTIADGVAAAQLQIGTWQDTDNFEGHIGLVGWWEGAMSDSDKEALDNNWRTSDWWNSAHGEPEFLVELNVDAGSVTDLASNASSSSHTGTTLDAGETLEDWDFDGTGEVTEPASMAWVTTL